MPSPPPQTHWGRAFKEEVRSSTEKLKTEARGGGGDVMHVNDPGSKLEGLGGRTGVGRPKREVAALL